MSNYVKENSSFLTKMKSVLSSFATSNQGKQNTDSKIELIMNMNMIDSSSIGRNEQVEITQTLLQ